MANLLSDGEVDIGRRKQGLKKTDQHTDEINQ